MNDETSGRGAPNAHGIIEERAVDRRRFLTQLGGAAALGASFLTFGGAAGAMARRAPRPIYMLSLGDSIMWGQGLAEPQKYRNLVQQYIRANNPERRDVVQLSYAHSGASLGYFPFGASGRSSKALRMLRARVAARNGPPGRVGEQVDINDPVGAGDWPDDSAGAKIDREIASNTAQRPFPQPSPEERYGGEIPRANPILWRQMDMAVADLQTRRINPADVDFVLLDGGANDVDFTMSILNVDWTPSWVEFQTRETIRQRMEGFLPWALKTFPNAKFVVTGYYVGVSAQTSVPELLATVAEVAPLYAALGIVLAVPAMIARPNYYPDTMARAVAFEKASSEALRSAVAKSGGRAIFVSPDFQPEHAYAAPQTLMFRYQERDPAATGREAECHRIYGAKTAAGTTGAGANFDSPEGICRKAATFHPNPAGARRYADRIIAALPAFMPTLVTAPKATTTAPPQRVVPAVERRTTP
ncbi:MAG TPA: hypothetical protein VHM30_10540 [Gemmatimonadaceae bacterium]|nr:hypothetical protein [Gemmatimonadaceae bacterium]